MDLNTRKILSLFASILFTIPVYIILHEGGHALIALSCGARITEFSILGAYMRYEGGTFTALTLSLFILRECCCRSSYPSPICCSIGTQRSPSFIEFFLFCFP